MKMEDALRRCGVEIGEISRRCEGTEERRSLYRNCISRQGPVLEAHRFASPVVLGTKGCGAANIIFHGQEAHSGSQHMNARRERPCSCGKNSRWKSATIAKKHEDAVCTMGSGQDPFLDCGPRSWGAVRSLWTSATKMPRCLPRFIVGQEASQRFAAEENCTVEWSRLGTLNRCPSSAIVGLCQQAVRETVRYFASYGFVHFRRPAEVSRAGIPTVDCSCAVDGKGCQRARLRPAS